MRFGSPRWADEIYDQGLPLSFDIFRPVFPRSRVIVWLEHHLAECHGQVDRAVPQGDWVWVQVRSDGRREGAERLQRSFVVGWRTRSSTQGIPEAHCIIDETRGPATCTASRRRRWLGRATTPVHTARLVMKPGEPMIFHLIVLATLTLRAGWRSPGRCACPTRVRYQFTRRSC